jgi:hypothetical protein
LKTLDGIAPSLSSPITALRRNFEKEMAAGGKRGKLTKERWNDADTGTKKEREEYYKWSFFSVGLFSTFSLFLIFHIKRRKILKKLPTWMTVQFYFSYSDTF